MLTDWDASHEGLEAEKSIDAGIKRKNNEKYTGDASSYGYTKWEQIDNIF